MKIRSHCVDEQLPYWLERCVRSLSEKESKKKLKFKSN